MCSACFPFFFFNDTATTEIYTLSLHDALPICDDRESAPPIRRVAGGECAAGSCRRYRRSARGGASHRRRDRKSTRLNSSHGYISYAVFCLKKKKKKTKQANTYKNSNRWMRHTS